MHGNPLGIEVMARWESEPSRAGVNAHVTGLDRPVPAATLISGQLTRSGDTCGKANGPLYNH